MQWRESLVNFVEVGCQVDFLFDPALFRIVSGAAFAAVRVEGDAEVRRRLELREIVHDRPELHLRRFEQPVHAARHVEAEDEIDVERVFFRDRVFGPNEAG